LIFFAIAGALTTLVIVLLLFYPGELSWVSPKGTRWLYDKGAKSYETKWQRHDYTPYDGLIALAASSLQPSPKPLQVLDLCCGTGRATLVASRTLGSQAGYTAVDFSPGMLASLKSQIDPLGHEHSPDIKIVQADVHDWLRGTASRFDLLLFMEAGEFLPQFTEVIARLGPVCNAGGFLVMTKPAGLWSLCFPGRAQTRSQLTAHLHKAGFGDVKFTAWRKRYELLTARKN
jgi:ubiquinone/menaquinone biosynthesis C-methylase UbiE